MKDFPRTITGVDFSTGSDYSVKTIPDGIECGHRGCRYHILHECEGCGRTGAKGKAFIKLD